jgi:hypothetical protein
MHPGTPLEAQAFSGGLALVGCCHLSGLLMRLRCWPAWQFANRKHITKASF